jgi:hypothetical protein
VHRSRLREGAADLGREIPVELGADAGDHSGEEGFELRWLTGHRIGGVLPSERSQDAPQGHLEQHRVAHDRAGPEGRALLLIQRTQLGFGHG